MSARALIRTIIQQAEKKKMNVILRTLSRSSKKKLKNKFKNEKVMISFFASSDRYMRQMRRIVYNFHILFASFDSFKAELKYDEANK